MHGRNSRRSSPPTLFVDVGQTVYPVRKLIDEIEFSTLLDRLESNENITRLDFSFSKLGDEMLILLAMSLLKNKTVVTLVLADSQISDKGLAALLVMLKTNTSLLEIDVSRNMFQRQGLLDKLEMSLRLNKEIHKAAAMRKLR